MSLPPFMTIAWVTSQLSTERKRLGRKWVERRLAEAGALTEWGDRKGTTPDLLAEHMPGMLTVLLRGVEQTKQTHAAEQDDDCAGCDALRARLCERDRQLAEMVERLRVAEGNRRR